MFILIYSLLGNTIISIKQEPVDVVKEEPLDYDEDSSAAVSPMPIKSEYTKSSKKKHSKKHKEEVPSKKSRKAAKAAAEIVAKPSKKLKKEVQADGFVQETSNSNNVPSSVTKPPGM